ncbi:unnamed protein product [Phytomonas sp. EM1]|nr:unnamed protein product [Phytomonas sp. EM1]|eukprot:CCW61441.1 unnamed protein product [Phytomonas sp. isolate EM1]
MKYVEMEDAGGSRSVNSHWKMRNAKDELMSPASYAGFYTAITIAAMEDTGYYKGNYSNAESMAWGKNAGCGLFNEKCVIDGVSQIPGMFCDTKNMVINEFSCTSNRLGIGNCDITNNKNYAPLFQYFTNPTTGGSEGWMDFCPYIKDYPQTRFSNGDVNVLSGSVFSESARCFSASKSTTLEIGNGENMTAVCADVLCDEATATYQVRVKGAGGFVDRSREGTLVPAMYSPEFRSGMIECPPYDEVCTGNPSVRSGTNASRNSVSSETPGSNESRYIAASGTTGGVHHLTPMLVVALAGVFAFA